MLERQETKSGSYPVVLKRSLGAILDDLDAVDAAGADPTRLGAELKAKVDSTVFYLERLDDELESLQRNWIELMLKKKARLVAKRERRLLYVKGQMERREMTALAGNIRKIRVAISPPAMRFTETPNAAAWEKYPGFVKVTPTYQWDKEAVKSQLEQDDTTMPFVEQTRGKHLRYKKDKK